MVWPQVHDIPISQTGEICKDSDIMPAKTKVMLDNFSIPSARGKKWAPSIYS